MSHTRMIALNIQTTGLCPITKRDRIIELAAIEIIDDKPTGKSFHSLFHPIDSIITDGASKINGLKPVNLRDAPRFREKIPELSKLLKGDGKQQTILLMHSKKFTLDFLKREMDEVISKISSLHHTIVEDTPEERRLVEEMKKAIPELPKLVSPLPIIDIAEEARKLSIPASLDELYKRQVTPAVFDDLSQRYPNFSNSMNKDEIAHMKTRLSNGSHVALQRADLIWQVYMQMQPTLAAQLYKQVGRTACPACLFSPHPQRKHNHPLSAANDSAAIKQPRLEIRGIRRKSNTG